MEIGTGLALLGGAGVAQKILGPTAEYVGDSLKEWTERRVHNVQDIFSRAAARLGDRIADDGVVPPRVLKRVLDDGSFAEDELTREYFGGVLASSRTDHPEDDRGAAMMALLDRLSTMQIRTHFLVYASFRRQHLGAPSGLGFDEREKLGLGFSLKEFAGLMGWEFGADQRFGALFDHVIFGLDRENLIEPSFFYGSPEKVKEHTSRDVPWDAMLLRPSAFGIELFLWAHGFGGEPKQLFLSADADFRWPDEVVLPEQVVKLP